MTPCLPAGAAAERCLLQMNAIMPVIMPYMVICLYYCPIKGTCLIPRRTHPGIPSRGRGASCKPSGTEVLISAVARNK